MGGEPSSIDEPTPQANGEEKRQGAMLNGSERADAVDHQENEREHNPDTELHLNGEIDTLYSDGIDVEEDFDTWAGTDGSSGRIP